jgi:hypothetical protein
MKYRPRIYYTETDKALMWDRWQQGESLNSIARHFDRHHSAIQGILSRTSGIQQCDPVHSPGTAPFLDWTLKNRDQIEISRN